MALCAAIDTATDPRAPRLLHTAEPADIQAATGYAYLHTTHCAPSGDIIVSAMGDPQGKARGGFILLDQTLKVVGHCHGHSHYYMQHALDAMF